ncbi:MAG: PhnD/SsuA/transferrin family substrate-binding protein [Pseudonocardiaceae bacterium]|nr:PhnD/SsuA/transferrin family substrate-binding protein [Pseudonocardiaceae bacterium]
MKLSQHHIGRRDFLALTSKAVGGAAVLGVAGGCGQANSGSNGQYQGEVAVAHLDAIVAAAPFHIAAAFGYYQEAGLELSPVSFPGGTETIRGMATGMDFGMPATLPGLVAIQKGQKDLRLVAGAFNKPAVVFLVPANSDIQSIEDMANKKVAISQPGSITTYFANRIAREQGLTPGKDIQLLNVGGPPDAWTAAKQGVADVAWSNPPLSDKLIKSGEARLVFKTSDYVSSWADTSYWTTQPFIDDSPDVIKNWLKAHKRAMDLIKNDVDKAAEAYAKRVDLQPEVARQSLRDAADALNLTIDMAAIKENVKAGEEMDQLDPDSLDLDSVVAKDFAPIKEA